MNEPTRIDVALGDRSYPILIGAGLLARAGAHIAPLLKTKRAIIVTDSNVAPYYAATLEQTLAAQHIRTHTQIITAGEGSKNFATLEQLCEDILALAPDRHTALIALGGGVVGDLAGFAASVLLRGIPFVQLPTSLLAQVDSSVGGKTAINTRAGKNLVGSFYQPHLVLADTDTFATLPLRERRAGYAEIIKYGLIMDEPFYRWCLTNASRLLEGDPETLRYAIGMCCQMKATIVAEDERESGARALLNFGHTFGHALEAETGMGDRLLHGEAVAIGMVMACELSARMGLIGPELAQELAQHFGTIGMAATPRAIAHAWSADAIARHFVHDKKAEQGTLTFVVLEAVGRARVAKAVDSSLAYATTASFLQE